MAKKITAPKTHKPSGGRPLEHLAYLNRYEMDYLMSLNGGAMSRGPRGLPSFAEETVGPGGGGGGGGSSGGPSSSGAPGGQSSGSTAPAAGSTQPQSSTLNRDDVMMVDALGNAYDYNGNRVSAAPSQNPSNSFASPNFPSTSNLDKSIADAAKISGAMSTVANTPAIKADGVTGFTSRPPSSAVAPSVTTTPSKAPVSTVASGIKSLNVGPMGTEVRVGSAPKVSASPSAKIGGSYLQGEYGPIQADQYTKKELDAIASWQATRERESLGLLGRGPDKFSPSKNDPRDLLHAPMPNSGVGENSARAAKERLAEKAKTAMSIAGALPGGALVEALLGIKPEMDKRRTDMVTGTVGGVLSNLSNLKDLSIVGADPKYQNIPGMMDAYTQAGVQAAMDMGLAGAPVGVATMPEKVAQTGMWAGRMSRDPAVQRALDYADRLKARGFSQEEIFNATSGVSPYMSGVMSLPTSLNTPMVELAERLNLTGSNPVDTLVRTYTGDARPLGSIISKDSPVLKSYPDLADLPVGGTLRDLVENTPQGAEVLRGAYQPGYVGQYGPVPEQIVVNYPQSDSMLSRAMIGAKSWANPSASNMINQSDFRRTLSHELGHAVAEREAGMFPSGGNPDTIKGQLRDAGISLPDEKLTNLSWETYNNMPGEYYANLIAARLGMPVEQIKNYLTSFSRSVPTSDIVKMQKAESRLRALP